jgi:Fe2+ or Zn2+ uptake regulation protein
MLSKRNNGVERSERKQDPWHLYCSGCGNTDRFVEVMSYELHLVDGMRNYIHLLEAEADHYICFKCGREIEIKEED